MKLTITALAIMAFAAVGAEPSGGSIQCGTASWYGEQHRGRIMANGHPFDPDKLTAASWFFPLGTRVRVHLMDDGEAHSVVVTITDRGPSKRLVAEGRIIDLGRAAFKCLADPDLGLVPVRVEAIPSSGSPS